MTTKFTEREALKQMIDYIQQERLRLLDEYKNVIKRLEELDKEERPTRAEEVENPIAVNSNSLAESMSVEQAISEHNLKYGYTTDKPTELRYNREKEIIKDLDNKNKVVNTPTRRSKYRDVSQVAKEIASILKEEGRPLRVKQIMNKLEDKGYSTHGPYGLITQAMTYESKIVRVNHGYYQYKW